MNKRFKFYLVNSFGRKKTIVASYADTVEAIRHVREAYPDWEISMFWPECP
jgi:hypothetical protein